MGLYWVEEGVATPKTQNQLRKAGVMGNALAHPNVYEGVQQPSQGENKGSYSVSQLAFIYVENNDQVEETITYSDTTLDSAKNIKYGELDQRAKREAGAGYIIALGNEAYFYASDVAGVEELSRVEQLATAENAPKYKLNNMTVTDGIPDVGSQARREHTRGDLNKVFKEVMRGNTDVLDANDVLHEEVSAATTVAEVISV